MSTSSGGRRYRSTLREEQAEATRRRILDAAASLFASRGFAATTLAGIAQAAGVSAETVKAAGTKAELLVRAFEIVFAGVEGADSLADTAPAAGILQLEDDDFVPALAEVIASANARSARLWTVLVATSMSDQLVGESLARMLENRRRDYLLLASELQRRGLAGAGTETGELAAVLSFLLSPESHQQLVEQSGWSAARYREFIEESIRDHR